jgi:hypothetical protein
MLSLGQVANYSGRLTRRRNALYVRWLDRALHRGLMVVA